MNMTGSLFRRIGCMDGRTSSRCFPGAYCGDGICAGAFDGDARGFGGDFIWGLLAGNTMAVLSWAFLTAPVAVKTRLTIYWQLKKVVGPWLTFAYSAFYAFILCLMAGAMVNVAVTSISIPFGIPNPDYLAGDLLPSLPWMGIALVVGAVIAVLAVLGFEKSPISQRSALPG